MNIQLIELVSRGQTIRTKSNVYRVSRARGMVINIPKNKPTFKGKFKGAFVGDMTPGLHDNVICIDFSSLYPSIIAAYNLCYTTFIHPKDWDKYKEGEYREFIVTLPITGQKVPVRYAIADEYKGFKGYKGILPEVVEGFLKSRKVAKAMEEAATEAYDAA